MFAKVTKDDKTSKGDEDSEPRAKTGAGRQVIPDSGRAVWVQGREVVWKSHWKARRIPVRSNTKW